MLLILLLIDAFFKTNPLFVSSKEEYVEKFMYNFIETRNKVFSKMR